MKGRRGKLLGQSLERGVHEFARVVWTAQQNVISLSVRNGQITDLDHPCSRFAARRKMAPVLRFEPRQGLSQSFGVDRFQEVVDRLDIKGLRREVAVRGDKHHAGSVFDLLQKIEPGLVRKHYVQEEDVGLVVADQPSSLFERGRFTFDPDTGSGVEQSTQIAPCRGLVVNNYRTQHGFRLCCGCGG